MKKAFIAIAAATALVFAGAGQGFAAVPHTFEGKGVHASPSPKVTHVAGEKGAANKAAKAAAKATKAAAKAGKAPKATKAGSKKANKAGK
jgi:hypothetical protein